MNLKANRNNCIGDIYGVIIELKEEFDDNNNINIDFYSFVDERLKEYIKEAKEWLLEDDKKSYFDNI